MKIFITGVAGFIGFHLAKKLCESKHKVIGIDNLDNYYDVLLKKHRLSSLNAFSNFSFNEGNLNDLHKYKGNYDLAINLAAQAGVRLPNSMHYKYDISNVRGFNSFLNFCKNNKIKNIIFASSSSVYGNNSEPPFTEDMELPEALNKYAESKIKNELEAKKFHENHNINIYGLRFFTVYGPLGRPDMAYFKFAQNINKNLKIQMFNGGELKRDMTFIDDITDGLEKIISYQMERYNDFQIFNMGNEKPVKTSFLLSLIEKELQKKALINHINLNKEVKITYADCTKAKKAFGFSPKVNIEHGISKFIRWYSKYFGI